ncbi:class F sortase [Streptomyces sp. NPDC093097]|uniref:class F sortase n=1 Tax=Streptomyces sp. NPDC093097 TaxID=3366027 RepID=UPI003820E35C
MSSIPQAPVGTGTGADSPLDDAVARGPGRLRRARHLAAASVLGAALGVGLTACSSTSGGPAPEVRVSNAATVPASKQAAPMEQARPTGLRIASAGVEATSMLGLGVGADQELEVPPVDKADEPGWWTGGVTPGEKGAAVIVAHYDTAKGPALMRNVAKVKLGDTIEVPRADGHTAVFAVREIQQVDKKDFPTDKVYGASDRAELRLLTCGGPIKDGHHTDNIIFYADLVA